MKLDEKWMHVALALARKGLGKTSPNPCVGAVIVRGKKLLGKGWHKRAGKAHAEIEAILDAKRQGHRLNGSTLYVTLEPCSTHGRTPPCTDAILREKFKRVVAGTTDPNPDHSGKAFPLLRRAGIEVTHGVLQQECADLNRAFNHWIQTGQPWVIAKAALTLDGKLALPKGRGRWISSSASRKDAHRLRAQCDAILVGAGTARTDNPRLTVREVKGARQPWRVVVTRSGRLPKTLHLFSDAHKGKTLVYKRKPWSAILTDLGRRDIIQLLVEGGQNIFEQLARKKLIREVVLYYAPVSLPDSMATQRLPDARSLQQLTLTGATLQRIGPDLKLSGTTKGLPTSTLKRL